MLYANQTIQTIITNTDDTDGADFCGYKEIRGLRPNGERSEPTWISV